MERGYREPRRQGGGEGGGGYGQGLGSGSGGGGRRRRGGRRRHGPRRGDYRGPRGDYDLQRQGPSRGSTEDPVYRDDRGYREEGQPLRGPRDEDGYADQAPPRERPAPPEPVAVSGILDMHKDGYGFLRSIKRYLCASPDDVFVPRSVVGRFGIRNGSEVEGMAEPRRDARSLALFEVRSINGLPPDDQRDLPHYRNLTSIKPGPRFTLEEESDLSLRVMDIFTPIGRGQRALIVAPPRTGKTVLIQKMANSILEHHPDCHVIMLLVDERPEEVTDMKRTVPGEILASSMDQDAAAHVKLASLALERARRLVEARKDVVLFLDSLTRMARAYNREGYGVGRTTTGGLEVGALDKPREFFGAARKCEQGGSLTIIATCLIETGSRMDDIIFQEFKGTGNMELYLERKLADRRVFPAFDLSRSGTRDEEKLLPPDWISQIYRVRRALAGMDVVEQMERLLSEMAKTKTNAEFLARYR